MLFWPQQATALAGMDAAIYQSGNFNASNTRMSKRGSKPLHFALINAAHNIVKNNKTFKNYYDKKCLKDVATTMLLDVVPVNLFAAFIKC